MSKNTASKNTASKAPTGSPLVSVIVGSSSDADAIAACRRALDTLGVPHEARVFSAHRTPEELTRYVGMLEERGIKVIIAAAGMAAALPGVVAAHTALPVLGVPLVAGPLAGVDALLAIAQMPGGVPVGCMGVGSSGGKNAAYLAARIIAVADAELRAKLHAVMQTDHDRVLESTLPETY